MDLNDDREVVLESLLQCILECHDNIVALDNHPDLKRVMFDASHVNNIRKRATERNWELEKIRHYLQQAKELGINDHPEIANLYQKYMPKESKDNTKESYK